MISSQTLTLFQQLPMHGSHHQWDPEAASCAKCLRSDPLSVSSVLGVLVTTTTAVFVSVVRLDAGRYLRDMADSNTVFTSPDEFREVL